MWQLVQPVVLRSGHVHELSSTISWSFPKHRSVCILHTVSRTDFLLAAVDAHTSKDELVTKIIVRLESKKIDVRQPIRISEVNRLPALKRYFANTFSS